MVYQYNDLKQVHLDKSVFAMLIALHLIIVLMNKMNVLVKQNLDSVTYLSNYTQL